eukprot:gene9480-10470_t
MTSNNLLTPIVIEDSDSDNEETEVIEDDNRADLLENLANAVGNLSRDVPLEFSYGGISYEMPALPGFLVHNFGPVSFPLTASTAEQLIPFCSKAPYGKGMDTVIDEEVRKTWELGPSCFSIKNPQWDSSIESLVSNVGNVLGFHGKSVKAVLYKFLLYDKGGHFKVHRDTEKSPGMFATLLIQLPSEYKGGNLLVHHDGKSKRHDFGQQSGTSPFYIHFAAHYSDVQHEVEEVVDGYRCILAYNLCWTGPSEPPSQAKLQTAAQGMLNLLNDRWKNRPEALIFPVKHMYSKAGLTNGSSSLKGHDAILASVLKKVNELMPKEKCLSFYIAKAEKNRSSYGCGGGYGCYDMDWEVSDEQDEITDWQTFEGCNVSYLDMLNLNLKECVVSQEFDEDDFWGDPVETEEEGYTGNAGPNKDEIFNKCVIVAIKKAQEKCLVRKSGSVSQIADLAFQQCMDEDSVNEGCENIEWLIKNWKSKSSPSLSAGTVFKAIAASRRKDLFHQFIKEVVIPITSVTIADIVDGLIACVKTFCCEQADSNSCIDLLIQIIKIKSLSSASATIKLLAKVSELQLENFTAIFEPSMNEIHKCMVNLSIHDIIKYLCLMMMTFPDNVKMCLLDMFTRKSRSNMNDFVKLIPMVVSIKAMELAALMEILLPLLKQNCLALGATMLVDVIALVIKAMPTDSVRSFTEHLVATVNSPSILESIITGSEARFGAVELKGDGLKPLLESRIKWLISATSNEPKFSWRMPKAHVPGHPKVEQFLRGPEEYFTYTKFRGVGHARNWIRKHFSSVRYGGGGCYSAKATEGGRGSSTFVTITKSRDQFNKDTATFKKYQAELAKLRSIINM